MGVAVLDGGVVVRVGYCGMSRLTLWRRCCSVGVGLGVVSVRVGYCGMSRLMLCFRSNSPAEMFSVPPVAAYALGDDSTYSFDSLLPFLNTGIDKLYNCR